MDKLDLRKDLKHLYQPSATKIASVDVPSMNFLMVDGQGDPNTSVDYANAITVLFSVSYTLKFMLKKAGVVDYSVMPLEGLWWAEDMSAFTQGDKSNWLWTAMIMQPSFVTASMVEEAIEDVRVKKAPDGLNTIRFEAFSEGPSAQVMYVGPYADEGPTIERIHAFIASLGKERTGKHHEIYMNDFRRTDPSKLKTVIRQPMK
jgi:hypothetical protein